MCVHVPLTRGTGSVGPAVRRGLWPWYGGKRVKAWVERSHRRGSGTGGRNRGRGARCHANSARGGVWGGRRLVVRACPGTSGASWAAGAMACVVHREKLELEKLWSSGDWWAVGVG